MEQKHLVLEICKRKKKLGCKFSKEVEKLPSKKSEGGNPQTDEKPKKERNKYDAKEFLTILDYSIEQIRSLGGDMYFNCREVDLNIEKNCIYCDDTEDVYVEKLEAFKREYKSILKKKMIIRF